MALAEMENGTVVDAANRASGQKWVVEHGELSKALGNCRFSIGNCSFSIGNCRFSIGNCRFSIGLYRIYKDYIGL